MPVMPRQRGRSVLLPKAVEGRRDRARVGVRMTSTISRRGRILIVDEGRRDRRVLSGGIADRGLEVDIAATAEAALKRVEARTYDAIFLDLGLRRMGGLEVLSQILRIRPEASVVILAGDGNAESRLDALRLGAFLSLVKPVDREMLDVVLKSCLERSRLLHQNAQLKQKIILDDLTTAFNRRHLDAYLEEELERSRRYGRPFSILFFDLDHLKVINDRYGHLAGSHVLREVAMLIQDKLRKSDRIFRYGGDEFIVTLPETAAEGALRVANRLRRTLRSHRFLGSDGLAVSLTASFGVATFPHDGISQEEMIRAADRAMYRVKMKTRDAVGAREV